jgi:hypothetical protein
MPKTALVAAFVAAAIEYPLAKKYPTTPSTGTFVRMAAVGALTYVSVVIAERLTKKETP